MFAFVVTGVAIFVARMRAAEAPAALTVFAAALVMAGLAVMLAGAAGSMIWRDGLEGAGQAIFGGLLATAIMAYPAYLAALAFALPKINDVSTDVVSPPAFLASVRTRAAGVGNGPSSAAGVDRAAQRQAYPYLETVKMQMDVLDAYRMALSVATDLGWRIVDLKPPSPAGGGAAGIEALDRSLFFGLPSDIVIRVAPGATSAAVDLRAASRIGLHDFGANAARIRKFIAAINEAPIER